MRRHIRLLTDVLRENKELITGPGLTIIPQLFMLPQFVLAFKLLCQDLDAGGTRYVLMACNLAMFIPQAISFTLYVLPSTFYWRQWRNTRVGQWISGWFPRHQRRPPAATTILGTAH
jgi:hypothetical protein